jgi:hypothetical protein
MDASQKIIGQPIQCYLEWFIASMVSDVTYPSVVLGQHSRILVCQSSMTSDLLVITISIHTPRHTKTMSHQSRIHGRASLISCCLSTHSLPFSRARRQSLVVTTPQIFKLTHCAVSVRCRAVSGCASVVPDYHCVGL